MSNLKALLHYKVLLPFLAAVGFFTYWAIDVYFSKPFVWDEIVSLTNFVLVDFKTTVTQYPDVNNHIFFNLVNNLYCKFLSVSDLYDAMDKVSSIRLLPFAGSLITIIYTWLLGKKFFNNQVAGMAVMVLITTMPFLNFTMQLRGYTLSATLLSAAAFHLLSFERKPNYWHIAISLIIVTALLYTIPSNVFFVLSLGILFGIKWLVNGRDTNLGKKTGFSERWVQNRYFVILVAIAVSAFLSYLLYLPVLEDILNERHLQQVKGQSFHSYNVVDLFPKVVFYLTSFRVLFFIPFVVGPFYLYRELKKRTWKTDTLYHSLFIFLLFLLPFVISFIRGDKTPQRSFIPLSGPFALLSAISIYALLKDNRWVKKYPMGLLSVVFIYCIGSYYYSRENVNKTLHKAILDGEKINTMMYNFYQSDEYGMSYLDPLIKEVKENGYPIVMANEIDRVSEGEYLHKNNLKYYSTVWSRQVSAKNELGYQYLVLFEISQGRGLRPGYNRFEYPPTIPKKSGKFVPLFHFLIQKGIIDQRNPNLYVLTFAPRWFEEVMKNSLPQMKYERMSPKLSYHNIYRLSLK